MEPIEIGFQVYLVDGGDPIGAVRSEPRSDGTLGIYLENHGDVSIPLAAIDKVVAERVVLRASELPAELRWAAAHAHDAEDYPPDEEPSVELEPSTVVDEEARTDG